MTSKMEFLDALVKRRPDLKDRTFKVLVCLAVYANSKDGMDAHPGEKRLAADVGISERRVRDHLDLLRESGWIQRVSRGSVANDRKFADVYSLTIPAHVEAPDAVDHRTPKRPVVDEVLAYGETDGPPDVHDGPPDVHDGPPDAQVSAHPGLCTLALHPSDPDGSGSSQAPIQDVDDSEEVDEFDKQWAYVDQEVDGLSPEESGPALGMLESGSPPQAVRNKILADRRAMFEMPQ